ncbi:MAG TPA: hypothetical protein VGT44_18400 [Ktedonobacteraceae bacterium]|nr:hypothetical protein [Ktedonobacteraceae bacterium]
MQGTQNQQNNPAAPDIAQLRRRAWRINGRSTLYLLVVCAPLAWAALLFFTFFVQPQSILAFAVFFLLLDLALTCMLVPLAYFIGLRFISSRLYRATMRHALRQGVLLSLLIVFNLLLRALRSWSIFTALVSLAIVAVIEVLALARK